MHDVPELFSFDEQTRKLDVQPHGRVTCALRFGSWSDGLPLFRRDGDADATWIPDSADPELTFVHAGHPGEPESPLSRFADDLPPDVRRLVAPFRRHQLTLLRMLRWCDGAASLIESAPVLAWLLAGHLSQRFDAARASTLLQQRRVAVLSAIVGAPMSAAAVRLLSRYTPDRWSEHSEQILLRVLREPKLVAWCSHEPNVTPRLLFALVRHRSLVDGRFLRATLRGRHADAPEVQEVAEAVRDLLNFGHLLDRADAKRVAMACTTAGQLLALRDRWSDAIGKRIDEITRKRVLADATNWMFPGAPLRGTDAIVPITSAIELLDEGVDLHHCAAGLVIDVLAGAVYFYKVLAPERATLSIRVRDGVVEIDELRGVQNAAVAPATLAAVDTWLQTEKVAPAGTNHHLMKADDEWSDVSGANLLRAARPQARRACSLTLLPRRRSRALPCRIQIPRRRRRVSGPPLLGRALVAALRRRMAFLLPPQRAQNPERVLAKRARDARERARRLLGLRVVGILSLGGPDELG